MSISVFIKDGTFYSLKRDKYESMERYNERGWFVVSVSPKTLDELNEAIRLSRIWICIKFDKCVYDKNVMDRINKYLSSAI